MRLCPLLFRPSLRLIAALAIFLLGTAELRADKRQEPTFFRPTEKCRDGFALLGAGERATPKQVFANQGRGGRLTVGLLGALGVNAGVVGAFFVRESEPKPANDGDTSLDSSRGDPNEAPPEGKSPEKRPPPKPEDSKPTREGKAGEQEATMLAEVKNFLEGLESSEISLADLESMVDLGDDPVKPEDLSDAELAKARSNADGIVNLPTKDELIAQARAALEEWKKTKKLDLKLGEFLYAAETLDIDRTDVQQATRLAHGLEMLRKDVASFTEILNGDKEKALEKLQDLHNVAMNERLSAYCRDLSLLPNLYLDGCGNCDSRSKLLIAALHDQKPRLPDNFRVGIQHYSDHVEPVVTDLNTDTTYGIVDASAQKPPNSKIFHPASLLHAFLEGLGEKSPVTYEELILDERAAMAKGKGGYPGPSTNAKFSLKKDSSLPWRASSLPPAFATSSPKIFGQDNARALNPNDYGRRLGGGLEASIPYRQNDDPDDLMKRKAKIGENSRMQNMPDASFIMWDYPDLEIFFRSAEHAAEWGSMSLPQRKQFLRSLFLKDMRRFWETNDLKEAIQHLEKGLLEAPADKIAPSLATIERYLRFMNQDSDGVEKRIPEFFRHDHRPLRNAMSAVNSGFTARFPETMKFLETNAVQVDDILGPLARINFILEHKLNYRLGWTRAEAGNSMYQPFPKFEHARITAAMAKSEETAISFKLKRLPPPPPDRPKPPELNAPEVKFFSESEFEQILDSYKKRAAVKDPPAKIEMSPILFLKLVSARERRGGYQMRTSEKLRIYDRWDNRVTQLCLGANAGEKGSKAHALKQLCATAIEDFVTASEGGVRMAPHAGKHGFDLLHPLEYFDPKREYLEVRLQSVRGIPWTGDNAAVVPKEFLPLLEAYEIKVTDAKPAVKPLPKPRRN